MTTFRSEDLLVGFIALALLPMIGWRIARGFREGRLPVYRTYVERGDNEAKFRVLLGAHMLSFLVVAFIAGDLLFDLDFKDAL